MHDGVYLGRREERKEGGREGGRERHDGVYLGGREGGTEGGMEGEREGGREGRGKGGTHRCTSANCRGRQSGSQLIYMPSSPTWLFFLRIKLSLPLNAIMLSMQTSFDSV